MTNSNYFVDALVSRGILMLSAYKCDFPLAIYKGLVESVHTAVLFAKGRSTCIFFPSL